MSDSLRTELKPHVWTLEQIQALPEFGNSMGWFYGLVEVADAPEKHVVVAELFPGMGYTLLDADDVMSNWGRVAKDLANYSPAKVAAR